MEETNATIVSETLKYSDGTEKVVNFVDPIDQSIPEEEVPAEIVEEPIEETVQADIDSVEPETSETE